MWYGAQDDVVEFVLVRYGILLQYDIMYRRKASGTPWNIFSDVMMCDVVM